jgi:cation diffusion facilitator CzcD-associated flavoprotein CzcO
MMDLREAFYDTVAKAESEMTTFTRTAHEQALQKAFPNDEEMRKKLTPDYHPGCKRIILSDDWFPALAEPNCFLETGKIKKIVENGIELEDGTVQEYDVGFRGYL